MCIATSDDAESRLFTVSLDEGLLYPLWYTAFHCRDSHVRRSSLRTLKSLPTARNVWHVETMTRSVEKCIEFEEADCDKASPKCEDIPEWRRVHSCGLDGFEVSAAKKTVTMYIRTRPNVMDGEWAEYHDSIHWYVELQTTVLLCQLIFVAAGTIIYAPLISDVMFQVRLARD